LHINSPGGDVYEAIAIMNTLRQHDAKVVTTVDGFAASSAGFIAVGASDELIVAENAEIMAHLPWAIMVGDSADMRKMADDLDRIGKNIASIFAARAGGTLDEWMAILTAETWWSAEEAVEAGIADKVLKAPKRKTPRTRPEPIQPVGVQPRRALQCASAADRRRTTRLLSLSRPREPKERSPLWQPSVRARSRSSASTPKPTKPRSKPRSRRRQAAEAGSREQPSRPPSRRSTGRRGGRQVRPDRLDKARTRPAGRHGPRRRRSPRAADPRAQDESRPFANALNREASTRPTPDTWREEFAKNREAPRRCWRRCPRTRRCRSRGRPRRRQRGVGVDAEMAGVFARVTGRTYGKDA
jgi:hypothetical protein